MVVDWTDERDQDRNEGEGEEVLLLRLPQLLVAAAAAAADPTQTAVKRDPMVRCAIIGQVLKEHD